jgi:glycogen synthase
VRLSASPARAPRRVLMTADAVGGVWTYALDLSRALAQRGTEVVLAIMGPPLDREQRAAADGLGLRLHEAPYQLEWMPGAWHDVDRATAWLLELRALEQPDLVHLNGYCHADLPWGAPVVVVGHSCVWSWWRAVRGGNPPREWSEYRRRVAAGLRAAHRVVAPTAAMLRALEAAYGPLPHGSAVHNGRFAPAEPPPSRKQALVFSAGRVWDQAKNLAALDRAAARLSWPVAVAGEARHPSGGAHKPHQLAALGRLSADDVAGWMARAAIYAAPALYEPFGLGPLEAAQAGCALVLGDIASLREVWGDAALFAPPDDDAALAAAIERLVADEPLRADLARAARARACRFEPGRMAEQYLEVYAAAADAAAASAIAQLGHGRESARAGAAARFGP